MNDHIINHIKNRPYYIGIIFANVITYQNEFESNPSEINERYIILILCPQKLYKKMNNHINMIFIYGSRHIYQNTFKSNSFKKLTIYKC